MNGLIYHITTRQAWDAAREQGEYRPDSITSEGFIHCSTEEQVVRVANAFYHGQNGLVLLEIKPALLRPELRWEPGSDKPDELFPHIHGCLNLDAVLRTLDFPAGAEGRFAFPRP